MGRHGDVIDALLSSFEPSVRFKVRVNVLGEDPQSRAIRKLRDQVRDSPRVKRLLRLRDRDGRITRVGVYDKWKGAHWVLAALADLGYPEGDASLHPMRDQVLDCWLRDCFYREFDADRKGTYRQIGVPRIRGRYRRCGSQQGNALLSLLRLGITDGDDRPARLVERLLHWQWPDGGWNCDKEPTADTSSFMETLLPMRGLALYARRMGDAKAARAADRSAEVFLSRRLFKRRADGSVIRADFVKLCYPYYWHYNILAGLVAMADMNRIDDPRCADALDLLESKQLKTGGWTAGMRYYKVSDRSPAPTGTDAVAWDAAGARRMNEWVTVDALAVLKAAGRLAV